MRTSLPLRALIAATAALFATGTVAGTLSAAPAAQGGTISLLLVGHVDVDGGPDPNCPTCNGSDQNTGEDQGDLDYAATDPLPEIEFAVFDMSGTEVGRAFTTANGDALQVVSLDVPELGPDEEYTVEIQSGPFGWDVCRGETSRTIAEGDIGPSGTGRLDFFFFKTEFCQNGEPTVDPGMTATPDGNTPAPGETAAATATPKPRSPGRTGKDKEQRLGAIAGVAFIDHNQNGVIDPGEPGLNDVGINIHGGGLQKVFITGGPGNYSFDGLGVGEYDVFIQPGAEWKITTPSRYKVKVTGNHVVGIDFGLVRADAKAPAAKASASMRLPATGIADFPLAPALGGLATLLGALAVLGFVFERRRQG